MTDVVNSNKADAAAVDFDEDEDNLEMKCHCMMTPEYQFKRF